MSFTLCALSCRLLTADEIAETQARFGPLKGDVQLLTQGAVAWIDAHEGLPIEAGDHIYTGDDGEADIALSENALWHLGPGSDLSTEHMDVNSGRFHLENGTLFGEVDSRHVSAAQHWEFDTPRAVCTVEGTEFVIDVSSGMGTQLAVLRGSVEMAGAEGPNGQPAPIPVTIGQSGVAAPKKEVRLLHTLTPRLQALNAQRSVWEADFAHNQQTWSPFTETLRVELRKKFVSAPPPPRVKPHPVRNRRAPVEAF